VQGALSRLHGVHFRWYKGYACRGARGRLARVHVPQRCTVKNRRTDQTKTLQWGCQSVERLTKRLLSCRVFQGTL